MKFLQILLKNKTNMKISIFLNQEIILQNSLKKKNKLIQVYKTFVNVVENKIDYPKTQNS